MEGIPRAAWPNPLRDECDKLKAENALLRDLLIELMGAAKPFADFGAWLEGVAEQNRVAARMNQPRPVMGKGPTIPPSDYRRITRAWTRVLREAPKE